MWFRKFFVLVGCWVLCNWKSMKKLLYSKLSSVCVCVLDLCVFVVVVVGVELLNSEGVEVVFMKLL